MNTLEDGVRRHGFRKWYERQLLSSHAHMVLAFLSVIGLLGSMEAARGAQGDWRAMDMVFVLLCAGIGVWALRRYLFLLLRAEEAANQANCPDCGEYGRFEVVRGPSQEQRFDVQCRKCSCNWTIASLK